MTRASRCDRVCWSGVMLLGVCHSVRAQTVDWARVSAGVAIGLQPGRSLWDVPNQTIESSNNITDTPPTRYPPDVFHLQRRVATGFSVDVHATRYSSATFGLTFDLALVDIRFRDQCTVVQDGGDAELAQACQFVGSDQQFGQGYANQASSVNHSGAVTLIQAGGVVRPFRPGALQPFGELLAGFATTPNSTIALRSIYSTRVDTAVGITIYRDDAPPTVRPVVTAGIGVTTAPTRALQLHAELRSTFLPEAVVSAPGVQGEIPPHRTTIVAQIGLFVGVDIAFSRVLQHRY